MQQTRRHAAHSRPARPLFGAGLLLILLAAASGCALPFGSQTTSTRSHTTYKCVSPATATASTPPAGATAQERLATLAHQAVGNLSQKVETTYQAADGTVKVTALLDWCPDWNGNFGKAQELSKFICFQVQQALWTSGIPLREATVIVNGLAQDEEYGGSYISAYGVAYLKAATAATINWVTLSPDQTWKLYDLVFLRTRALPSYEYVEFEETPDETPSP